LQATLRRQGIAVEVVDGGVSGDTSEAGKARLGWTIDGMSRKPDLVIVELGANDMLRGLDPKLTERNLDVMLADLKRREIPVLIAGMRAAPNLDPAYIASFEAIYPGLARKHGAALYPFFMDGVAGQRSLIQADGMHPTFQGVKRIVTGIAPAVKQALESR
jgi:acyl-CoA thioesterase-1